MKEEPSMVGRTVKVDESEDIKQPLWEVVREVYVPRGDGTQQKRIICELVCQVSFPADAVKEVLA